MVQTVAHLSEAELEAEYVTCSDARRSRHLQAIRLLAKGHSVAEVSTITASLHDSHGGIKLLHTSREHWPFLRRCFADSAYPGPRVAGATAIAVTVVSAPPGQKGFAVQLRRWVIERSFAHAGRCRRLARDHEATPTSALGFFTFANAMLLVRRMAQEL